MERKKLPLKDGAARTVISLERSRQSACGVNSMRVDEVNLLGIILDTTIIRLGEEVNSATNEEATEIAWQLGIPIEALDLESYDRDGSISDQLERIRERVTALGTGTRSAAMPIFLTVEEAGIIVRADRMLPPSPGADNPQNDFARFMMELAEIVDTQTNQAQ